MSKIIFEYSDYSNIHWTLYCKDGCFFVTSSLRPVIADMEEENDDDAGLQDKNLPKRNQEFHAEREVCSGSQVELHLGLAGVLC